MRFQDRESKKQRRRRLRTRRSFDIEVEWIHHHFGSKPYDGMTVLDEAVRLFTMLFPAEAAKARKAEAETA